MKKSAAMLVFALLTFGSEAASAQVWEAQNRGRGRGRGEETRGPDAARDDVREGRRVPMGRVIAEIERRTPGRILDSWEEERGGRTVYRVRWQADDGRRIDYIVDAQSGRILGAN